MTHRIYNPHLHSDEALIEHFVVRDRLFRRIIEDLLGEDPPHQLLIGQRGMGKTTLLRRVAAEVDRDPSLRARWIALRFPEEQYNIATLSDLWINCLDALAVARARQGEQAEVARVEDFVTGLPQEETARATQALDKLLEIVSGARGLVLCIDNLQQVLGRLKAEAWALRKVLGGSHRVVVLGASPGELVSTYDEPFYDFFQAHRLRGLDLEETRALLLHFARRAGPVAVAAIEERAARVKTLHVLTGGNPRILVILAGVISADPDGDVREQLEQLLDQITPLYKARFDELSDQPQRVLDALAMLWDPATAAQVAAHARLEVNSASTQLARLHEAGLVDKVDIPGTSRQGFQVGERFFNIWYLMRASRKMRGKLRALTLFMESMYEVGDPEALADRLRKVGSDAELALVLSDHQQQYELGTLAGRHPSRPELNSETLQALLMRPTPLMLAGIAQLVRNGRAPDLRAALEPKRDEALPLYAALVAIEAQDPAQLGRFAPEVAEPARTLLDQLWPPDRRPPPAPTRKARRKRS